MSRSELFLDYYNEWKDHKQIYCRTAAVLGAENDNGTVMVLVWLFFHSPFCLFLLNV